MHFLAKLHFLSMLLVDLFSKTELIIRILFYQLILLFHCSMLLFHNTKLNMIYKTFNEYFTILLQTHHPHTSTLVFVCTSLSFKVFNSVPLRALFLSDFLQILKHIMEHKFLKFCLKLSEKKA